MILVEARSDLQAELELSTVLRVSAFASDICAPLGYPARCHEASANQASGASLGKGWGAQAATLPQSLLGGRRRMTGAELCLCPRYCL